jgi:hypothetical protein
MKNQIITAIAILFLTVPVFAQPPHGGGHQGMHQKSEKIKAMKVEYITSKLDLSSAEAEKFWPVYNEYMAKMQALEKGRRQKLKENYDIELSDDEVNNLISFNFETDQNILDLRLDYDKKFRQVLSIQKVGKLYRAEHDFKRELLRKMKGNGPPK